MSNELQRLANSIINAESIANSDRNAIVKILTALAQETKDEPNHIPMVGHNCKCGVIENYFQVDMGQGWIKLTTAEYADYWRNKAMQLAVEVRRQSFQIDAYRHENERLKQQLAEAQANASMGLYWV